MRLCAAVFHGDLGYGPSSPESDPSLVDWSPGAGDASDADLSGPASVVDATLLALASGFDGLTVSSPQWSSPIPITTGMARAARVARRRMRRPSTSPDRGLSMWTRCPSLESHALCHLDGVPRGEEGSVRHLDSS